MTAVSANLLPGSGNMAVKELNLNLERQMAVYDNKKSPNKPFINFLGRESIL